MYFTKEKIEKANNIDLINYVRQRGLQLKPKGKRALHAKGYGGLYFFIDNNKFYQFSTDVGGGIIDFVMNFENKTFNEAVETLIGAIDITPVKIKNNRVIIEKGDLLLPERAENTKRIEWYLTKIRGIDKEVVRVLIMENKIYQAKDIGNYVFVAYSKDGVARHCSIRGTYLDASFRMDVANSDKGYSFHMEGCSDKVFVFESPIDAMSHATITKIYGCDYKDDHRISLGGVSDIGLERFLKNTPHIKHVTLCLDNDEAGFKAMDKIIHKYKSSYKVKVQLPNNKDFNEDLKAIRHGEIYFESDSSGGVEVDI